VKGPVDTLNIMVVLHIPQNGAFVFGYSLSPASSSTAMIGRSAFNCDLTLLLALYFAPDLRNVGFGPRWPNLVT
jgi:hypothetical protein